MPRATLTPGRGACYPPRMSGHSKWATIKRKKGAVDAKRGKIFTKLIREIATAARLGGADPNANPRLRLAMDKARAANMPKANIDRAIKKGSGEDADAARYEEVVYEGYGPGGVAILIETLTDNRNRTAGEVRHVLSSHGGNLGESGCVSFLFSKKGSIRFERDAVADADALLEAALEAGAEDVQEADGSLAVLTAPSDFDAVRESLAKAGFTPVEAAVTMEPATTVPLAGEQAQAMLELAEAIEDLDDVQEIYSNFDIPDDEMARIA